MRRSAADQIAVAVIGAGFIADYHINGLRAAGRASIAALVGRREEATQARAAALGIGRAETDYRRVKLFLAHFALPREGEPACSAATATCAVPVSEKLCG